MPKQHEILAVATGRKAQTEEAMTEAYKVVQKGDLFDGFRKTYRPLDAVNGEQLPAEIKNAQQNLTDVVRRFNDKLIDLVDVTLTMDAGNMVAKADIVVDGVVLAPDVPVTTLLFLTKQVESIKAFVEKLPTPDAADVWNRDENQGLLATAPVETHRTKKTQRAIVLYDATKEHPAQTQLITEDVLAGYWTTIKYTSRIPASVKAQIVDRVSKLLDAVKVARERANDIEVTRKTIGSSLIRYVFADYAKA